MSVKTFLCVFLFNSLIKFSRRYRSVVRACILDLEEKSGMFLCFDLLDVNRS